MERGEKLNVAIEIGSFNFKIAVVKKSANSYSLEFFKVLDISTIPAENRINYIIEFIEKELVSRVLLTRTLSINFCDSSLQVKIIELPLMPKKELNQAIEWYLNSKFGIDSTFAFDYEITEQKTDSEGTKKMSLVCAIVPKDTLQKACDAFAKKGFIIEAVNIPALGFTNLLKELDISKKEVVGIVDIGCNATYFSVYAENKIKFIRKFFIGSQQFSESIRDKMQSQGQVSFSEKEANLLKEKYGIPEEDFVDDKYKLASSQLLSMLRPCLDKFLSELKSSIDYFQETAHIPKINTIFLVGGGARLKNLDVFLSEKLNTQIRSMDIPKKIMDSFEQKQELQDNFVIIAGALGLSLDPAIKVNLLPSEFQVKKYEAIAKLALKIIGAAIIVLLTISLLGIRIKHKSLQKELDAAKIDRELLEDLRIVNLRVEIRKKLQSHIVKDRLPLFWYLKEVSRIIPSNIILDSISVKIEAQNLDLDGIVFSSEKDAAADITNFMAKIEDSDFFESADLVSSRKIMKDDATAYAFSIKCKIE